MRALLIAAVFSVGFAVDATAQCQTVQPGPGWICVGQGWLPPGHPSIPPTATPTPSPTPLPAPAKPFRIGRRYVRGTTDLFIMGTGQSVAGNPVLLAQCLQVGDGCFYKDMVRMLPANADAYDFVEHLPSPYDP